MKTQSARTLPILAIGRLPVNDKSKDITPFAFFFRPQREIALPSRARFRAWGLDRARSQVTEKVETWRN